MVATEAVSGSSRSANIITLSRVRDSQQATRPGRHSAQTPQDYRSGAKIALAALAARKSRLRHFHVFSMRLSGGRKCERRQQGQKYETQRPKGVSSVTKEGQENPIRRRFQTGGPTFLRRMLLNTPRKEEEQQISGVSPWYRISWDGQSAMSR